MNLRRGLRWFYEQIVALAERGALLVPWDGKLVRAEDAADVDAYLAGQIPPALTRKREQGTGWVASAGGDVG